MRLHFQQEHPAFYFAPWCWLNYSTLSPKNLKQSLYMEQCVKEKPYKLSFTQKRTLLYCATASPQRLLGKASVMWTAITSPILALVETTTGNNHGERPTI